MSDPERKTKILDKLRRQRVEMYVARGDRQFCFTAGLLHLLKLTPDDFRPMAREIGYALLVQDYGVIFIKEAQMGRVTNENVAEVVRYHRPTEEQIAAHERLAVAAENFIREILASAPECADRSDAIRKVREAKMVASAAVALEGLI